MTDTRTTTTDDDKWTPLGVLLDGIVTGIAADQQSLEQIMDRLAVRENVLKSVVARAAEVVGRVTSNGTLTHHSPSSRVVELEGLLAAIAARRNVLTSLRTIAGERSGLDAGELDVLIQRATAQRERLVPAHDPAARVAFSAAAPA